jgi:transcriptional antiterminator/mannitol/fructose-specific phosphotransferase system IIA component (Ntr-type)
LKKRSIEILQYLSKDDQTRHIVIDDLAAHYGVSRRMLYNDISEINNQLKVWGIVSRIMTKKGTVSIMPVSLDRIRNKLREIDNYSYKFTAVERQSLLLLHLLRMRQPVTMQELADRFFVSRITILSDIQIVRRALCSYHCALEAVSRKGVIVRYDERNARIIVIETMRRFFENVEAQGIFQNKLISEVGEACSIAQVTVSLQKIESEKCFCFSNEGFILLILYVFVSINRFVLGFTAEANEGADASEYDALSEAIIRQVSSDCGTRAGRSEARALAIFILEKKPFLSYRSAGEYTEMYVMAASFLSAVFDCLSDSLQYNRTLFELIVLHFRSVREGIRIPSDLEGKVIADFAATDCPDVYRTVREKIYIAEQYFKHSVSEDYLAVIALQIGHAIDRANLRWPKLTVAIVCPGSMATGHLLALQIRKHFDFKLAGVFSTDDIETEVGKFDFLISTVSFSYKKSLMLVVNPILKTEDFIRILLLARDLYKTLNGDHQWIRSMLAEEMDTAISVAEQKQSLALFSRDLRLLLNKYSQNCEGSGETGYVHEIINPAMISVRSGKVMWEEAVRTCGNLLTESGCASGQYIDAIVENTEKFGFYYMLRNGVALGHAHPDKGVYQVGLSLLVHKDGIDFGVEYPDVRLLFCLSATESGKYLGIFKTLVSVANDENLVSEIASATNSEEVFKLLKEWELSN